MCVCHMLLKNYLLTYQFFDHIFVLYYCIIFVLYVFITVITFLITDPRLHVVHRCGLLLQTP